MSTKVAGVTVSAKIKDERVIVFVRETTVSKLKFWASDYPFDEHAIDKIKWIVEQDQKNAHAPLDPSAVTPTGHRIMEAAVKEIDIALAAYDQLMKDAA